MKELFRVKVFGKGSMILPQRMVNVLDIQEGDAMQFSVVDEELTAVAMCKTKPSAQTVGYECEVRFPAPVPKTFVQQVTEFHEKFNLTISSNPSAPSQDIVELRKKLIAEEYAELIEALDSGDLANIAKEAADLHYVVSGMCVTYGIPETEVFNEVHRSNLSKVWPDGSVRRREDGKILKPPTYSPADIHKVFGGKK